MSESDAELIARLRNLMDRATRPPWKVFEDPSDTGRTVERRIGTAWDHPQLHGPYPVVNGFVTIDPRRGQDRWEGVGITADDAALIVGAINALAALLDTAERAERYRKALWQIGGCPCLPFQANVQVCGECVTCIARAELAGEER